MRLANCLVNIPNKEKLAQSQLVVGLSMMVLLLQLNDVTQGGSTVFPLINAASNPIKVNVSAVYNIVIMAAGVCRGSNSSVCDTLFGKKLQPSTTPWSIKMVPL